MKHAVNHLIVLFSRAADKDKSDIIVVLTNDRGVATPPAAARGGLS